MLAFKEFKKGKRHKAEVADFEINQEDNIVALHQELENGSYVHGPYYNFKISDPKPRIIHKATVKDRVVHQAVCRVLYPLFDSTFINDSYSSRKSKGTHRAVKRLIGFCQNVSNNQRYSCYGVKLDIRKYFDSIDHTVLKRFISKKITCAKTLGLVMTIIDSFNTLPNKGLPLGNVTSQLFANIYLHELDLHIKHQLKEKFYLRFCDDFIVLRRENNFKQYYLDVQQFLKKELRLELKGDKLEVRKLRWGFDFLGTIVLPYCAILRGKTQKRMMRNLANKFLLLRLRKISFQKFNQSLQSYLGQLKHINGHHLTKIIKEKYGT